MKTLIYSQEDLDLILSLKTEEKDKEIERLKNELAKIPKAKMEYDLEIEQSNNIIKSLFDYCKEQQEKSFDSVAEECYAEVMYFISERLEKTKELKESGNNE